MEIKRRDLRQLLHRLIAALETPDDLLADDVQDLIMDASAAADSLADPDVPLQRPGRPQRCPVSSARDPNDPCLDKRRWMVWQLADDRETYGENAGKTIITTLDQEDEICSVIPEDEATKIVAAHNAIVDSLR